MSKPTKFQMEIMGDLLHGRSIYRKPDGTKRSGPTLSKCLNVMEREGLIDPHPWHLSEKGFAIATENEK